MSSRFRKNTADGVWYDADEARPNGIAYSDGDDVEFRLLSVMQTAVDRGVGSEELEAHIRDFPSRYHLSASRTHLLRPVAGLVRGSVLEIGAGCGAITRFLGEHAAEVVAVEGSRRRAAIAAARCRDLPGVSVVAARVQDLHDPGTFDVVTLIGVLEYARCFAAPGESDPVSALLAHARTFLKPGGTLLLAIENQLGLKYFALYPEDHLGQPLAGIENRYGSQTAITFGRAVLGRILHAAGLDEQQWFYPFPDYKFPSMILTEAGAAFEPGQSLTWAIAQTALVDPQRPASASFGLQHVWPTLWENGLVADLANSFLIAASATPIAG